ncbi:MAG TPA: DUF72 domain-containing protein [Kineosporiaceae bacterium]|nr:DUF72 domain-containing protein [Kineosporiaceae bacterium]
MPHVYVGISGWRYPAWRGVFYPAGLPQRAELGYAAARLDSVEINGSFYSLQRPQSFRSWAGQTPDGFVFAVKGGRYITHLKRLSGVGTALANFFASGLLALGPKLGPVLWQLPPALAFDPVALEGFLAQLPPTTVQAARLAQTHDERMADRVWTATDADRPLRHALEVRHQSFAQAAQDGSLTRLLSRYQVALVVADTAGRWPLLDHPTAGFAYARLHGDTELYVSGYGDQALDRWAARVRGWLADGRDAYVYFDNDAKVRAPADAIALRDRLRPDGW